MTKYWHYGTGNLICYLFHKSPKKFLKNKAQGAAKLVCCSLILSRRIQHILDEDPISGVRLVDEDMGDGAHNLSVLQNGTAAQE